ncbi:dihydroorotase [Sulfolobales archaeon HS-7]|nr:dihydroorotase [Sulfolobales archaeon HS-7]
MGLNLLRILSNILLDDGSFVLGCVEFDRIIRSIRKECKPDLNMERDFMVPAGIDLHVHIRGAQLSYKEDVRSFSMEAARGGIGLAIDMPNTEPYINNREKIISRLEELKNSRIDYALYSGYPEEYVEDLPIAGYKLFPQDLERNLEPLINSKKLKILHPESPISLKEDRRLRNLWEEYFGIREMYGHVHITHITSKYGVELSKRMGFTTDVTPHHMLISRERTCIEKVNPPYRGEIERRLLNLALFEVDAIASDHAPHAKFEKNMPFSLCPPGVPLVSFTLPFVFSMAIRDIISFKRAMELVSENPSKILGINMGTIRVGNRANITILSREEWRYSTAFSKATTTPIDGYKLYVKPVLTIVEGKVVFDQENVYPIQGVNPFAESERFQ